MQKYYYKYSNLKKKKRSNGTLSPFKLIIFNIFNISIYFQYLAHKPILMYTFLNIFKNTLRLNEIIVIKKNWLCIEYILEALLSKFSRHLYSFFWVRQRNSYEGIAREQNQILREWIMKIWLTVSHFRSYPLYLSVSYKNTV